MKQRMLFLMTSVICIFMTGCSDIIEESLSKKTVSLKSPANNSISQTYNQSFSWEPVDGALNYDFQLAKPGFDSVGYQLFDTILTDNKIIYSLTPGNYQWRVKARNSGTETPFALYNLRIDSGSLSNQTVRLLYPVNNDVSNNVSQQFSWEGVFGATKYRLIIDTTTHGFLDTVISTLAFNPGFDFTFHKSQTYNWKVIAENASMNSQSSEIRKLVINIPPDSVHMYPPSSLSPVSHPTLSWSTGVGADKYKLYIYKADRTTSVNSNYPKYIDAKSVNSTSYQFTEGDIGSKYYWKVTVLDSKGNESGFGELHYFVIQ